MGKFTHLAELLGYVFDDDDKVEKARRIVEGILKARSPRLSEIALHGRANLTITAPPLH